MSDDRIGQQFGNYRLKRLLGEGGFAEVYLGEHVRLFSPVAVKLLRTKLITREQEEFLTEASTIAALDHPSIVRVVDCGIEHGQPFLVMNYAPNGTLRQRYPKGTRVPSDKILEYVLQVADALQYAHELKLIHRDVKPENMLLGRHDELMLSDFGIALISSSSSSQSTKAATGTVSYMAPEQILGKPRVASDQYGLGIVIYEWLCGELPFRGSFAEVSAQHLYALPPSLVEKDSTISPDAEAVVMKALAKEPSERFATVLDFARALQGSYEQTLPAVGFLRTVSVSPSQGPMPASSALEDIALAATVPPVTPIPAEFGPVAPETPIPPVASEIPAVPSAPAPLPTVAAQMGPSVLRPDTVSIDVSKMTLHGVGGSEANEKTDESGKNASATKPIPLVGAFASMVLAGRPRRNLFIVLGTVLVVLLVALPMLAFGNRLFVAPSHQNQGVVQLNKTPSPSQSTPTVNSGQLSPTPTPTQQPTPTPTSMPTPTPISQTYVPPVAQPTQPSCCVQPQPTSPPPPTPTPTPQPVWTATFDGSSDSLTFNNYQVTNPTTTHFLIIYMTFTNKTSQSQAMNSSRLYLIDVNVTRYYEDQASNPWNTFVFSPGQTAQLVTAYVVPDNICQYGLIFLDPTGQTKNWIITINPNFCT